MSERYSTRSTVPSGQSSILSYSDAFFHFYSCFIFGVLKSQTIYWRFLATEANNQLEMIRKQAEVAKFEVIDLSRNLRRDSEDRF